MDKKRGDVEEVGAGKDNSEIVVDRRQLSVIEFSARVNAFRFDNLVYGKFVDFS